MKPRKRTYQGVRYLSSRVPPSEIPRGWTTCGTCGRSWDDTASTALTPAPGGRCPFEYWHTKKEREA